MDEVKEVVKTVENDITLSYNEIKTQIEDKVIEKVEDKIEDKIVDKVTDVMVNASVYLMKQMENELSKMEEIDEMHKKVISSYRTKMHKYFLNQ